MNSALLANALRGAVQHPAFAKLVAEALEASTMTPALRSVVAADRVLSTEGDLDAALERAYRHAVQLHTLDRARITEAVYGLYYAPVISTALLRVALEVLGDREASE